MNSNTHILTTPIISKIIKISVYRYKRMWDQEEIVCKVHIGQTHQMSNHTSNETARIQ